jgi:hypothetical protein
MKPFSPRFGLVCIAILSGLFTDAAAPAAPVPVSNSALKAWRQPAVDRARRLIFNNDGNEPVYYVTNLTAADLLQPRTAALVGSQVDSIFYCTWSSGFGMFTHFTKVGQVFTTRESLFARNKMEALLAANLDPLRVMLDFAKSNRLEFFWSLRMNDTHDGSMTDYGPIMFQANRLKMEHPEYLLGKRGEKLKHGAWSGVDYARPEIRDLAFYFVEEVCRNYDVDGVELDFFRHPVFFKSTTRGETATAEECAQMTDLMRRIRTMVDAVGQKRGRPLLIAMRVPDSVEYCRAIGLELDHWLADDLLDLLIVSSYFQLNDWDYSVALARKHGVKIYPSLDEARLKDEIANKLRRTTLAYRGRAAKVWSAGADGVYLFNYFNPRSPLWRELGDATSLAKMDKDYFGSLRGVGAAAGGSLPLGPYQHLETLNPAKPNVLKPGQSTTARLHTGNDFEVPGAVALKLRLQFSTSPTPELIKVELNGQSLSSPKVTGEWLEFAPAPNQMHTGANQVTVVLGTTAPKPVKWTDLMLEVRHHANPLTAPR